MKHYKENFNKTSIQMDLIKNFKETFYTFNATTFTRYDKKIRLRFFLTVKIKY